MNDLWQGFCRRMSVIDQSVPLFDSDFRKLFQNQCSAMKVVYLAIMQASKKMDHADSKLESCDE